MGEEHSPKTAVDIFKGRKIAARVEMMDQERCEPAFYCCQNRSQASHSDRRQCGNEDNRCGSGQDFLRCARRGFLVDEGGDEKKDQCPATGIAPGEKLHPAELQDKTTNRQHQAEQADPVQKIGMEKQRSGCPDQGRNVNQHQ